MHALRLYDHARMVSVSVHGRRCVKLCVSQLACSEPDAGARKRIVLLHGNPANMHDFGPLALRLRDDFDVVAIDLPGFGRSERAHAVRDESLLQTYARHVESAVERIGWNDEFHLLGHSHGGAVAQVLAALFPDRVAGLVLLGSLGVPPSWSYGCLALPGVTSALRVLARALKFPNPVAARRRIVRAIMEPIFAPMPLADAWIAEQLAIIDNRPEILVTMALVAQGDPCAELARNARRIRVPTLFIHGDSDSLVPTTQVSAIHEIVARSAPVAFHELPQTGHMLQLSHADPISTLIKDWTRSPAWLSA
jgi:pimeloyl-ACP methyl ester carboxylesterase